MLTSITIIGILLILVLAVIIFLNTSAQIGQKPEGDHLEAISLSQNYGEKGFVNFTETTTGDIWEALKVMPDMFFGENGTPEKPIPVEFSEHSLNTTNRTAQITWYGHSAFLIEMEGKRILIDPMFGKVASPTPFGSKRFELKESIPVEDLKNIDVVIISHDHYDHLDYPTIKKLKDEIKHFITPLGVGSHLKSWGIDVENITELDWWQTKKLNDIEYTSTPSRHFSGRGITDRDATQWAGWAIKSSGQNIYFSGDSGYGSHFAEIGKKLGPFDFAMIECGQYNEAWNNIHMLPEESVQAGLDLNTLLAMPIHWGAFKLAPHSWLDPIHKFSVEALNKNLRYITPEIGHTFELGKDYPDKEWWNGL